MKRDPAEPAVQALLASLRGPVDVPPPVAAERQQFQPQLEQWIAQLPELRESARGTFGWRQAWRRMQRGLEGTVARTTERLPATPRNAIPRTLSASALARPWFVAVSALGVLAAGVCAAAIGLSERARGPALDTTQVSSREPLSGRQLLHQGYAPWGSQPTQPEASSPIATLVAGTLLRADGTQIPTGTRFGGAGDDAWPSPSAVDSAPVRTPKTDSALVLVSSGVQATFGPDSVARLPAPGNAPQLNLWAGQVSLDVPPMPAGTSFVVITPDTQVTVHGTRFTVRYPGAAGQGSCVRVSEGRVEVTHAKSSVFLNAGEASGCDERERSKAQDSSSTLARQNRLLQSALVSERKGDTVAAERALRALLRDYPDSPFAPDAKRTLKRIAQRP